MEKHSEYAFDVFVSYASPDREFAREVVVWLTRAGFSVWIDEEQLIPGTRFRSGLAQGLRESCNLLALLTDSYSSRKWTEREIDVFDLAADSGLRKILAIDARKNQEGAFDQVFHVHQLIQWSQKKFEPEGFWRLYCGLKNQPPGPKKGWTEKGQNLVVCGADEFGGFESGNVGQHRRSVISEIQGGDYEGLLSGIEEFVGQALPRKGDAELGSLAQNYVESFRHRLQHFPSDTLTDFWVKGQAVEAAIVSLLLLPEVRGSYSAWPFVDLAVPKLARWYLNFLTLKEAGDGEIWFSWAVMERSWYLLPLASSKAKNREIRQHFLNISEMLNSEKTFKTFEESYNYGVMVTPWNHFHLCWIALKLGDEDAALAHALALCRITGSGDPRAVRFYVRFLCWPHFASLRSSKDLSYLMNKVSSNLPGCNRYQDDPGIGGCDLSDFNSSRHSFERLFDLMLSLPNVTPDGA